MKLLSGILTKNNHSRSSNSNNTSLVTGSLNSNSSITLCGSNYSNVSASVTSSNTSSNSSVSSLSSSTISKKRKEQQQLNCSSSADYCNTSTSINTPHPSSKRALSNKLQQPSHSIFSNPNQLNNKDKEQKEQPLPKSSPNTPNRTDTHHKRQLSEDFLNSLSFALPQIEYEEAMKQVQQRTAKMANQNDNNITAENIEVMPSDGYDFEYYNKEEEERKLKRKASKKKTEAKQQQQPPSGNTVTPSTSFKSPIKGTVQTTVSQTPTKSTNSSSLKSKQMTPALNHSTDALTSLPTSKVPVKPSDIRNKIKKKDTPPKQQTPSSKKKPTVIEQPATSRKERKNSEKSNTSSKSGKSSSSVNSSGRGGDEDVIAVIVDDEDMNDLENDTSCNHEMHTTETIDEEEDGEEDSCNTLTSPHTPCSKKRKAFEEFEDSPTSSKKKKDDSMVLDSVIKKVMEISIPDAPAVEEDSPTYSSSLSISPSLSYNSESTCGEHSEYCSSPPDSLSYDTKLYNSQSSVDIKEVNQKITILTKIIEQRNTQITQRDDYIMNLSKENKDLKKFKSMIYKLDDVGLVFYMKASELVCEGLMARDLNTKESQDIIHDSLQKGIRYMRASAEFGNVDAMFEYAELILRYSKSKKHEAKEFLQRASEKGHKKAGVFLKSLELREETQRYEKSVEHDHLFLYGQEVVKSKPKRK